MNSARETSRRLAAARRLLLIDVDNQRRWIGARVTPEVHIPPQALLTLAAVLRRERPEIEIRVVTSSLDTPKDEDLVRLLDDWRPDVVGLRSISFFTRELLHVSSLLQRWDEGVPVVVGGPVAAAAERKLLERHPEIPLAVRGEGEFALPELLAGTPFADVKGLIWRDGDAVVENPARPLVPNLDDLPFADYSLIDLAQYERQLSYAYNHRRQGVLYTSRGCVYRCSFCFQPSGVGVRYRSAANVFAEIRALHDERGVRDFYFIDDIFNVNKRRAMDVYRQILSHGLEVRLYFVNGLRADLMDEEHIDLMVEAGAVWVTYAIETVNSVTQKLIRKELDMPRAERAIRYTQDKGVVVNVNTMFGFPGETREMADETLDWIERLGRPSLLPYHFALKGYEGCEIVEQAEAAGWDVPAFMAESDKAYNHVPIGTPTFPRRDMIEHMVEYHTRFGAGNPRRLADAVATLRHVGYTDRDLADMYSVLLNRNLRGPEEIVPVGQPVVPLGA